MSRRMILVGALAVAALLGEYGTFPEPSRALLIVPFLAVAPGLAWFDRIGDVKAVELAAIAIGLSLAMETAIGTLLLICGLWAPVAAFEALLVVTFAGLLCTWRGQAGQRPQDGLEAGTAPPSDNVYDRRDQGAYPPKPRASEFELRAER